MVITAERLTGSLDLATNPLIAFYQGTAPDDRGRLLAEIQGWTDDLLEDVHDYIQWLFPLPERSGANPDAPVLDGATVAAFKNLSMRDRLRTSFIRMLSFYGAAWDGETVSDSRAFTSRAPSWLTPLNHNHLRITRILRSIRLLGLDRESAAFLIWLGDCNRRLPGSITPRSYQYWLDAASGYDVVR